MELRHLKYFLAVAQDLNIGRAAQRLHISQPPLTRQIKALEEELGVELFVRTGRGVELTQAGEMFKEEASKIRMIVEAAIDRVQRAGAGKLGRLDVGIFGSAIYDTIPRVLERFRQRHPGVNVVLHSMDKTEQIEALLQRRINVAFNRLFPPRPGIGRELVAIERLFVVLPATHEWVGREVIPISALQGQPLVLFPNVGSPNFVDHVLDVCKKHGFEPLIAQQVGDAVSGVALVARGFGLTLIPESAAKAVRVLDTVFKPLAEAEDAAIDVCCLYRASDESPLLQAFLDVVRNYRREMLNAVPESGSPPG
ncbi:MAG: LysR family transcriptional regulator [Pseudomonadales bacterium]|jgi:DNA-binding transcriptional LysR family regulator|nr:LysR family transcriptional regulator [Pseudomonadales bacterium]